MSKPNEDILSFSQEQLVDERSTMLSKMDELEEVTNSGGKWDDEQRKAYSDYLNRLEAVNARMETTDVGLQERASAAKAVTNLANFSRNVSGLNGNIQVRPRFEDDPRYGFETDRDFLNSVVNLYAKGGTEDQRLIAVINAVGDDEYSRGAWEKGGVFVPSAMSGQIMTTPAEDDFMSPLMTQVPMTAPSVDIVARVDKDHSTSVTGGTVAYRTSETKTVSLTSDEWEKVSLKASELNVASAATKQLLRDSPISIAAIIEQSQGEAQSYKRMDEYLNGSGNGCPLGILNVGNQALLQLDRQTGQADSVIVSGEDALNMRKRVYRYSTAVWLCNHDLMPHIATVAIESANNAGIVKLFEFGRDGKPDTFNGRPIYFTEYMPGVSSGADNDINNWSTNFLALVNWSEYLRGIRGTATQERSIHVRFLEREEMFLFTSEDDGRPWWKTVLTPKNGISTRSPFVTLTNTDTSG